MSEYSFIIPVYNCRPFLEACCSSVRTISQYSKERFEIVLVDDGSTDGSSALCDELGDIVIHQQNKGVSAARNAGLDAATGDYVIFIDGDDTIDPEKMAECMAITARSNQIDMLIYGLRFDYYHKGKRFRTEELLPPYEGVKSKTEWLQDMDRLYDRNCLSSLCTRIIRKRNIGELRFREDMIEQEDLEFSLRALKHCDSIYFCPKVVYLYRQMGNSSSRFRRIADVHSIVERIDEALAALECEKKHIINTLTKVLEYEKLNSLTFREVCAQYSAGEARRILFRRMYSGGRHTLANIIKRLVWNIREWNHY